MTSTKKKSTIKAVKLSITRKDSISTPAILENYQLVGLACPVVLLIGVSLEQIKSCLKSKIAVIDNGRLGGCRHYSLKERI